MPLPGRRSTPREARARARRRSTSRPCEAYRDAWAAYRAGLRRPPRARRRSCCSTGCSRASAPRTREAKAERAAVDFEDLELRARDLLADDAALRARWAERFALIMVDEFQDTNRLQLDILERLERDNLFAVGDEFQSIYGFRHADVRSSATARALGAARRGG